MWHRARWAFRVSVGAALLHWALLVAAFVTPEPVSSSYVSYPGYPADTAGLVEMPPQVGQLFVAFTNADGVIDNARCTASVVDTSEGSDPGNGSVLLTAAHCFVRDGDYTAVGAQFVPGLRFDVSGSGSVIRPFGSWSVGGFVGGWSAEEGSSRDRSDDIGFALVCPRPDDGAAIADVVGALSIEPKMEPSGLWTSIGYPRTGDAPMNLYQAYVIQSEASRIGTAFMGFDESAMRLNAADAVVGAGMSGAPVFTATYQAEVDASAQQNTIGYVITTMGGRDSQDGPHSYYGANQIDERAMADFAALRDLDLAGALDPSVRGDLSCPSHSHDLPQGAVRR